MVYIICSLNINDLKFLFLYPEYSFISGTPLSSSFTTMDIIQLILYLEIIFQLVRISIP